jgi:hypothetical protein
MCSITKEDTQGVKQSFSDLLAKREAMDAMMWKTPEQTPLAQQQLVIPQKQVDVSKQQQKQVDIACILQGDVE